MQFVDTPRLRFHYRTQGSPHGMPIVLVHGSYATSRWWERLLMLLPDEFLCFAPDMRGCGGSERPGDGYAIDSQAADLAAFINALGLRDFDLVAHGAGGATAVEYALSWPDRLRSLTLVNSVPVEGAFTPLEAMTLLHQMRTDAGLLRRALASLLPHLSASGDPLFDQIVADAAAMDPAAFTETAAALNQWNRFADARALTLPCLLVLGDEDPMVGRDAATRSLIAIPGAANLEVIAGAGHAPMLEAPLAFAERLVDFLTDDFGGYASVRARAFDS